MLALLDLCVSSLRRGHANLLCIVPIWADDPRWLPEPVLRAGLGLGPVFKTQVLMFSPDPGALNSCMHKLPETRCIFLLWIYYVFWNGFWDPKHDTTNSNDSNNNHTTNNNHHTSTTTTTTTTNSNHHNHNNSSWSSPPGGWRRRRRCCCPGVAYIYIYIYTYINLYYHYY